MYNGKNEVITISLPKDLLDTIDQQAEINRRTRSGEIVFRLENTLKSQ